MYLDNSATTQVSEEVFEEMKPFFTEEFGNPSTLYGIGRESKKALELARQRVADAINAKPDEIIFTQDDCLDGKLYPVSNRIYEINIKRVGEYIIDKVGACDYAIL